jgi:hypothetical protein
LSGYRARWKGGEGGKYRVLYRRSEAFNPGAEIYTRVGKHNCIIVNYRDLDIKNLIRSEIEERKGRSMILYKSSYKEIVYLLTNDLI